MIRAATIVSIALMRAAIAATLAYAVLPNGAFVAMAASLDALAGVLMARRALRGARPHVWLGYAELGARIALFWAAKADLFRSDMLIFTLARDAWPAGNLGTLLVWLAPIGVARIAIVPFIEPWRAARLHEDERLRQTTLAIGVSVIVIPLGIARLLRRGPIDAAAMLCATIGLAFIVAAIVDGERRRRWLAAVRKGEVTSHRLEPMEESPATLPALDESPDAVLIAQDGPTTFRSPREAVARVRAAGPSIFPQVRRLVGFTFFAGIVTLGFDGACWNGSGWIPMRHRASGDLILRPHYIRPFGLMEWVVPHDPPQRFYWRVADKRLETAQEVFARVAGYAPATSLVLSLPQGLGLCAEPRFIRRHVTQRPDVSARSLDERARVSDPVKRDGKLIYTWRRDDEHLVRAEVALDGKSATCTVDPPPVEDVAPVPLTGVRKLALGGDQSCAIADGTLWCWGRVAPVFASPFSVALPDAYGFDVNHVSVGEDLICHDGLDRVLCIGPRGGSVENVSQFFAGALLATVDAKGAVRMHPPTVGMDPPSDLHPVASIIVAKDRACALRLDQTIRCWGPRAPALENEKGVNELGVSDTLACVRHGSDGSVWCTSGGTAPPTKIKGLRPAVAIAVGAKHVCALDKEGAVWCWTDGSAPTRVLTDATAIAAGASHTCALGRDTKVRCWGDNRHGQLGDGTFVDRATPTEVVR